MKKTKTIIISLLILTLIACTVFFVIANEKGILEAFNPSKVTLTPAPAEATDDTDTPSLTATAAPTPEPTFIPMPTQTPDETNKQNERYGSEGRLYLREWSAALLNSTDPEVLDMEDTACYSLIEDKEVITDRGDQGFNVLDECEQGEVCYIRFPGENERAYVCDYIDYAGKIEDGDVFGSDGSSIFDSDYDLIMYVSGEEQTTVTGWYLMD